jgi:hypothetical protein
MNHWTDGLDSIYFMNTTINKYVLESHDRIADGK